MDLAGPGRIDEQRTADADDVVFVRCLVWGGVCRVASVTATRPELERDLSSRLLGLTADHCGLGDPRRPPADETVKHNLS